MTTEPYVLYIDSEPPGTPIYGFDAYNEWEDCGAFRRATFFGKPLPKEWRLPQHRLEGKGRLRDFIQGYSDAPFVSSRAYDCLSNKVKDCAELRSIGCIRGVEYFLMNVLRVIDCVDIKKSDVRYYSDEPDKVMGFGHYSFRRDMGNAIHKTSVFILPYGPRAIFVNDEFVNRVRACKLTGIGFEDPNNQGIMKRNCVFPDLPLRS
jgi:hypothetical protein